jgi:hypothetical protein
MPRTTRRLSVNITRLATALVLLAALGTAAHAPSERIREQVKAGLAEVVRNDDVLGDGDSRVKVHEPARGSRPSA